MLPEDRIRVTKRETVKTGDGYRSCEISIERSRPSGFTIADAIVDQETEVDNALDRFRRETAKAADPTSTPPAASATASGPGDSPTIPETGWTSFKSGKGAWIRSEEAAELASLLAKSEKKSAVISDYVYKLSGDSDQFINRFSHTGGHFK